jgi:nucleotide-binding universal stress UspA family protein
MTRVLVPLDGTSFSARILPDARRVAGAEGELVLIHDTSLGSYSVLPDTHSASLTPDEAQNYLEELSRQLENEGVKTEIHQTNLYDVSRAIDLAAQVFKADIVAIATHGHGPLGRLAHGSTAWHAVAHSPVPVLLRHAEEGETIDEQSNRRIMVPLDGSQFAERALPLAEKLAREWGATLVLTRVIPTLPVYVSPFTASTDFGEMIGAKTASARSRLQEVAARLTVPVEVQAVNGSPTIDVLADRVQAWKITEVVMASHGHTGLTRVIVGSVADGLIHKVHCPVLLVPAHCTAGVTVTSREEIRQSEAVSAR